MTAATAIFPPPVDAPRTELARLCRQICLARATGDAAAPLQEDLSQALASVRSIHGADSVHDDDVQEIFQAEQSRVADATVLAELLAPKVAAYLQGNVPASLPPSAPQPAPPPRAPRSLLSASQPAPAAPAGPLGIADLLDGMLEQDRHDERTRRTGSRR